MEEVFSKLNAGEAGLRRALHLLARMRVRVLSAAVAGTLVAQDPNDQPPSEVVTGLGGDAAEDLGIELPSGWACVRLGAVSALQQYGVSVKAHSEEGSGDVPVLRMGNLQAGRIDLTDLKYVAGVEEGIAGRMLADGDLLFNRTNSIDLVGKSAVYRGEPSVATFASYLIRVRTVDGVEPEWCASVINSQFGRAYIREVANQQVGQANVNGTKLKNFPLLVPPHAEQCRILAELERIQSFIDACERARWTSVCCEQTHYGGPC